MPCLAVRPEEPVGAPGGDLHLAVREMSGDSPRWLDELEEELGLGNTPAPDEPDGEIPVVEAIEKLEFSWSHIRDLIMKADENPDTTLFRRILTASDDDAMIFTSMIGLPYYLAVTLGYDKKLSRQMTTFVAASYVIAMRRGYALGQQDMIEERPSRDE